MLLRVKQLSLSVVQMSLSKVQTSLSKVQTSLRVVQTRMSTRQSSMSARQSSMSVRHLRLLDGHLSLLDGQSSLLNRQLRLLDGHLSLSVKQVELKGENATVKERVIARRVLKHASSRSRFRPILTLPVEKVLQFKIFFLIIQKYYFYRFTSPVRRENFFIEQGIFSNMRFEFPQFLMKTDKAVIQNFQLINIFGFVICF